MSDDNKRAKKPTFSVLSFSHDKLPQPIEKQERSKPFVSWGKRNLYPDTLVRLFKESAIHGSIVKGKCQYVAGNGWSVDSKGLSTLDHAKLLQDIRHINRSGEALEDIGKKAALDKGIFAGVSIEVIWSKDGKSKELFHIDFGQVRKNIDGTRFFWSEDWSKYTKAEDNVRAERVVYREFDPYDPDRPVGSQLFWWAEYAPGPNIYPDAEYLSALNDIDTEAMISKWNRNRVANGFHGGWLFRFKNGEPSPEEQDEIERRIKSKFGGPEGDEILIDFADAPENALDVEQLQPADLVSQFSQLREDTSATIFISHGIVSPMLFGVKTEGQLGGRTEIIEANELFQARYVAPNQRIIERIFNFLLGTGDRLVLNSLEPISFQLSESVLANVLTTDELRQMAGFEALGTNEEFRNLDNQDAIEIDYFKRFGRPAESVDMLFGKPLHYDDETGEPIIDEQAFRQEFALDIDLTELDKQILGILKDNPKTTVDDLAKAVDATPDEVNRSLARLHRGGAIEINDAPDVEGEIEVERVVTEDADIEIEESPAEEEIVVMYKYDKRPDVSGPAKIETTRDFCSRLLALNRVYTREEIDQISALAGRNVWLRRGGFWTRKGTNTTTPFCRHIWSQQLVRVKK